MTPRLVRTEWTRNYGGRSTTGHSYKLDGVKCPGVTSVIGVLDKPALVNWAARQAAELAVNDWDRLALLSSTERLAELSYAHRTTTESAAQRGTRIHRIGEQLAHGRPVEVPDDIRGPVEAYARFLDEWEITATRTELSVCSTQWRYAGTADGFLSSPKLGHVLLDIKTGGVFPEVALQLAAYRFADLAITDQGEEVDVPEVEACYVAQVKPDSVDLVPIAATEKVWNVFLHLLWVHREWIEATKANSPIRPSVAPGELLAS